MISCAVGPLKVGHPHRVTETTGLAWFWGPERKGFVLPQGSET